MQLPESAGRILMDLMETRGLSAAELSRQTGIDAGILRKIMTGRETAVSTRNLMALSRYFDSSMADFIDVLADVKL